jgi:hypothetical protein
VEDWESLIHKSIRVNDGFLVGNVGAIDYKQVLLSTKGARIRYKIPKHIVMEFDHHGVFLEICENGTREIQWWTGRRRQSKMRT